MPHPNVPFMVAVNAIARIVRLKTHAGNFLSAIVLTGVICVFLGIATALAQDASSPDWMAEVERLARSGDKISAIKLYRERTGVTLKEAKDAVFRLPGVGTEDVAAPGGGAPTSSPSLNITVLPIQPKSTETLNVILQGDHASGVSLMTLSIAGQKHVCNGKDRCEFHGLGPFSRSPVDWTALVRAVDGTEVSQRGSIHLTVIPESTCTISGRVAGTRMNLASQFTVFLWGPNNPRTHRASARFDGAGRYRFKQLPAGRYDVTAGTDSKADNPYGMKPARHSFECQPGANLIGDFELP